MDVVTIVATLAGVTTSVVLTAPKPYKRHLKKLLLEETARTVGVYRMLLEDGRQIYKLGIVPLLKLHGSTLIFRVTTYNYAFNHQIIATEDGVPMLCEAIAFCGLTGLVSDVVTNPFNLTRAKMYVMEETQSDLRCQFRPDTSRRMMRHLVRAHGYGFLLTGVAVCIPRGFISSSMHLLSYLLVKDILEKNNALNETEIEKRITASVIGAAISCCCVAPFDQILYRLHNQPLYISGRGILYDGVTDCFLKTYRSEGIHVFYKGIVSLCLKVCPVTAVTLLVWDAFTHGSLGFRHNEQYLHVISDL